MTRRWSLWRHGDGFDFFRLSCEFVGCYGTWKQMILIIMPHNSRLHESCQHTIIDKAVQIVRSNTFPFWPWLRVSVRMLRWGLSRGCDQWHVCSKMKTMRHSGCESGSEEEAPTKWLESQTVHLGLGCRPSSSHRRFRHANTLVYCRDALTYWICTGIVLSWLILASSLARFFNVTSLLVLRCLAIVKPSQNVSSWSVPRWSTVYCQQAIEGEDFTRKRAHSKRPRSRRRGHHRRGTIFLPSLRHFTFHSPFIPSISTIFTFSTNHPFVNNSFERHKVHLFFTKPFFGLLLLSLIFKMHPSPIYHLDLVHMACILIFILMAMTKTSVYGRFCSWTSLLSPTETLTRSCAFLCDRLVCIAYEIHFHSCLAIGKW